MTESELRIPVGIVVTRSKASTPWQDYIWRPTGILMGEPETAAWSVLGQPGESSTLFYAGTVDIELFRSATAQYRDNLAGNRSLWVVMRPTGDEPPFQLFLVTADPSEAVSYTENATDLVEMLEMPGEIAALVEAFVAEHHRGDEPFVKRKRDRADPEALARRIPGQMNNIR